MNEVIRNIITRRSVKKYKSDIVPKELIDEILTAGTYAPTGRNLQAPVILAVTDKKTRDMLSKINADVLGTDADPFYGAPVVLAVLADKRVNTFCYDGSLVMGNMMLAAHSLGLGSCWIHRAKETFETAEGKELLKSVGLEGEYEGIGNMILGYADGEYPVTRPRKDNYVYYI